MIKPKYRVVIAGDFVIGIRNRTDGMCEMHAYNRKNNSHRWYLAKSINAIDLINGNVGWGWITAK